MPPDITLPSDFTVSKNHGVGLKLSALMFDQKAERVVATFEMHDGVDYLGPKVHVTVNAEMATIKKLNGDVKEFPAINFATPAVGKLIDLTKLVAFVTANGGDLKQGT